LARREYARGELQRRLRSKGYPDDAIDDCLDALEQAGLQSDVRFTEEYIRMRHRRGYGPLRITAELGERGIARRLIDEQLNAFIEPSVEPSVKHAADHWSEQAGQALYKRYPEPPPDLRERVRRERFLRNRGFSADQVKAAMRNYSPQ
jgi:regulatory protein